MELFLIRHAQSQNNALPETQRVPDPGLTAVGCQQAELVADWSKSLQLTRLVSSPFLRTLETTERIRRATGLDPEVRTLLHEQGGCFRGYQPQGTEGQPGMSRREIEQQFARFRVADIDGAGWWKCQPYESYEDARLRAHKLLTATLAEFGGTNERVAYVMHADILLLLLEHFHSSPLDVPWNTSITRVVMTAHEARLADFNLIGHLPEQLKTR